MDMRDPLEKAVDRAAVARRVRNAETTILEQHYEIERLTRERDAARAALKTIADHSSTESDFPHCVAGFQNYARRALEQTARDMTPAERQRMEQETAEVHAAIDAELQRRRL